MVTAKKNICHTRVFSYFNCYLATLPFLFNSYIKMVTTLRAAFVLV